MSSETYVIVFAGNVTEGHETAAVRSQLARLLKVDKKKVEELFSGKRIILKRTSDKSEAVKYGKALKQVGADIKIKVIPDAEKIGPDSLKSEKDETYHAKTQPKTTQADAIKTMDNSSMTLAPNVGDLFDPITATQPPNLDLSEYSVLDNDGSFILDPSEAFEVDLDLSAYAVAENDGSYLSEDKETIAYEINAPDFGLAQPGSILETIQEDKQALKFDTTGMTLASAGSTLLEEDEKRTEASPPKPDTSGINLVPNFDI